ncbi:MAG: flagellar filament capping protein FliD [Lachnospiraceae bacterium]|nr:flagellar filament capping protein FliD [Lachnospiraceae bacterium]
MAIRISGMISGLDTDSMVQELVSAYSKKTEKYEKEKTKLEWKQEAWKELNTKIYDLYSKTISNLRFSSAFNKKSTTVSDESKASVSAATSAVKGTQTLEIKSLAAAGYMTGAELRGKGEEQLTKNSTLGKLGIKDGTNFTITVGDGQKKTITLNSTMTINDFTKELSKHGVTANFDTTNQRFFISSNDTGADYDFELGGDAEALKALGLNTDISMSGGAMSMKFSKTSTIGQLGIKDGQTITVAKKDGSGSQTVNLTADMTVQEMLDALKTAGVTADFDEDRQQFVIKPETEGVAADYTMTGSEGTLKALGLAEGSYQRGTALDVKVSDASLMSDLGITADTSFTVYTKSGSKTISIKADETIADVVKKFEDAGVKASFDAAQGKLVFDYKNEDEIFFGGDANALNALGIKSLDKNEGAIKLDGTDAEIVLNGATFKADSNTFSINGLTITAKEVTEEGAPIKLVTDTNVDDVYDTIKEFITGYNELINEMDSLYNADSAKGYEPLTDDEKESMSEKEIEKWEEKIKDSLLRRDSTISSVTSAMKSVMQMSFEVDGKRMSLSSFGIGTGAYLSMKDNEKNALHIDGDAEDDVSSGNEDKLKKMIASDPDTVADFFSQLANALYDELGDRMKSTTLSSAFTIYNDKQMEDELDDLDDKISKWEDYVTEQEDYWYDKFSAMEKALSQLQSQTSALSGLLGS